MVGEILDIARLAALGEVGGRGAESRLVSADDTRGQPFT